MKNDHQPINKIFHLLAVGTVVDNYVSTAIISTTAGGYSGFSEPNANMYNRATARSAKDKAKSALRKQFRPVNKQALMARAVAGGAIGTAGHMVCGTGTIFLLE